MAPLRQERRVGLEALDTVTALLQRIRSAHPRAGLYEAADLQWWWSQRERPTDELPQLFWFDPLGQPAAAIVITDTTSRVQLDPIVLPDASPDLIADIVDQGLANAAGAGYASVGLEVSTDDDVLLGVLLARGFVADEDGVVEAWLAADARPTISPLADGYRLTDRAAAADRPHHMINEQRQISDPEPRMRQTSLYRPSLDLVVLDREDDVAAYGLFWFDPVTATGLVEPMRTEDAHQRRGLARHVLTAGLGRLVEQGATDIKICFEADNPASSHLYTSVGFRPDRTTIVYSGPTSR